MLLRITNGYVAFGANIILSEIQMEINRNDKIALVGRNGSGKTTLLKLLVGEYPLTVPDNVQNASLVVAKSATIGYLKQVTFEDETLTLLDEVKKAYHLLLEMERRIEQLLIEIEQTHDTNAIRRCADLQERFHLLDGYSYKKEYTSALRQFGFSEEDQQKPLSEFSGGQRTKIAFIRLILSKPDILLLDEPTNHLDINAIQWLEEYLRDYKNAVVIVAHDREFLNRIVTTVYELEYGHMTKYAGNYSAFAEKKQADWEMQQKKFIAQQKEIAHLSGLVERFRYKATKAAMAQSKLKQIERIDVADAPKHANMKSFHADFEPEYPSVQLAFSAKDLDIGYTQTLSTLSLRIQRGDKIGIIGGNGLGKSTFLKTMMGQIPALGGSFFFGDKVKVGYYDQQMATYQSELQVLEDFWDTFPDMTQTEVRSALGAFLFSQDDVYKPVNALSGGEKVRLALCKIFKTRPNFLILDEPTNHMDIIGKETLERILRDFSGTLLFVSHDRYFIKQIATSLLVFEEGRVSYDAYGYVHYLEQLALAAAAASNQTAEKSDLKEKRKVVSPGKEKARLDARIKKLEGLLAASDETLTRLKAELVSEAVVSDYVRLTTLQEEIDEHELINLTYLEEWDALQS